MLSSNFIPKRTAAASRGFLATARLSCFKYMRSFTERTRLTVSLPRVSNWLPRVPISSPRLIFIAKITHGNEIVSRYHELFFIFLMFPPRPVQWNFRLEMKVFANSSHFSSAFFIVRSCIAAGKQVTNIPARSTMCVARNRTWLRLPAERCRKWGKFYWINRN